MPSPPTVKPGDFVIAPFTHGCGHCAACLADVMATGYHAARVANHNHL